MAVPPNYRLAHRLQQGQPLHKPLPLDDDDDANDDGLPLLGSEPPQPREPQQRLQPPISRLSMRFGSDPVPASSSSGASSDSLGFTAAPLSSELARTSSNGASNDSGTGAGSSNVLTSSTSPQEGPTIVNRVLRNVTSPRSLAQSAPDNGGNAWRRSSTNAMTAPGTPPMKARLAGVRMSSSLSVLSSERSRKIESARSIDLDLLEELLQSETTFERHLGYCSKYVTALQTGTEIQEIADFTDFFARIVDEFQTLSADIMTFARTVLASSEEILQIGGFFTSHLTRFSAYEMWSTHKCAVDQTLLNLIGAHPKLSQVLRKTHFKLRAADSSFYQCLRRPFERLSQYNDYLQRLRDNSAELEQSIMQMNEPGTVAQLLPSIQNERSMRDTAAARLSHLRHSCTSQKESLEAMLKMFEIIANISNLPSDFFDVAYTRSLVKHGVLTKQIKGKPKTLQVRTFFLFSDVLVYCSNAVRSGSGVAIDITSSGATTSSSGAGGAGGGAAGDDSVSGSSIAAAMLSISPQARKSIIGPLVLSWTEGGSGGGGAADDGAGAQGASVTSGSYQFKGRIYGKDILASVEEENTRFFSIARADEKKVYTIKAASVQEKHDWVAAFNRVSRSSSSGSATIGGGGSGSSSMPTIHRGRTGSISLPGLGGTRRVISMDEEIDYDSITTVLFEKKAGVSIRERSFNLRKTSQALSGQDMIISLVQHTTLNRDDAMRLCQELLVREYIKPTPNRDQPSPPVFYDKPSCMYKRRSGRCLNTHRVYSGPKVTDPLGLSIELLNKLLALYSEYQTLILRFGSEALANIQSSPEFQTFRDSTTALQSVSLDPLSDAERLAFFYNIYNTLMLHSCVANHKLIDSWSTLKKRLSAWKEISYSIGANRYSLLLIELGMIRANMKPPESPVAAAMVPKLTPDDARYKYRIESPHPLSCFALCYCTAFSPGIVVFTAGNIDTSLNANAMAYCRSQVRLFLHSGQKKVVLPKLLSMYSRDFGATQRDMLVFLRTYMDEKMQQDLAFLDQPNSVVTITFNDFNWSFQPPILDCESDRCTVTQDRMTKNYAFPRQSGDQSLLYVQELLSESKYAFEIPYQFLTLLLPLRRRELHLLEQRLSAENAIQFHGAANLDPSSSEFVDALIFEREVKSRCKWNQTMRQSRALHLDTLVSISSIYRNYNGGYQGLTFRPTTYKKDSVLRCIPINLHTQLMRVSEQQSFADAVTFENITFGAPAAHCFKFKTNLRVLHETRMKLLQQATALAEANGQPVCAALLPPCKLLPTALVSPETSMNAPVSAGLTFLGSEQLRKLEEVEYLLMERSDVCIPQALAALVTSFLQKLELSIDNSAFQEQLAAVGFLVHFESLLSTHGSEIGMLSDMEYAVRCLSLFAFSFRAHDHTEVSCKLVGLWMERQSGYDLTIQPAGPFASVPPQFVIEIMMPQTMYRLMIPSLRAPEKLVTVFPVLFTQGINENQTVAIRLGECKLQEDINIENLDRLQYYFARYRRFREARIQTQPDKVLESLELEFQRINAIIRTSKNEKNVEILPLTADFTRRLHAGRLTSCKSAKDRTSMSITWEQARILNQQFGVSSQDIPKIREEMRSNGVRRENAFKNIGKQKFAFNKLQLKLIPEEYRAPKGTGSGTART